MDAAEILRRARRQAGMTQRRLAERAGTSQSTVAAYERGTKVPSVATLDRLVRAAGLRLTTSLEVPTALMTAAERMAAALAAGDEPSALRHAAELAAALDELPGADVALVLATAPPSTGVPRWDALLAGIVERAAHRRGVAVPAWTAEPERFLAAWWFVNPYRSLRPNALVHSPPELATRGVFLEAASLERV